MKLATFIAAAFIAASAKAASEQDNKIILASAPTSSSCAGATYANECATNDKVADPIIATFQKYNLTTPGEQANVLAWMSFESGDYKYNMGHFGDHPPGKGTRCMISPAFNFEFAKTVKNTETDPANMLSRLLSDGYEFSTCAWYYSTKCSDSVKKGAQDGTLEGHKAFLTECVQTTLEDKRITYWQQTAKAFGLSGQ